jgi:hypothetical protein
MNLNRYFKNTYNRFKYPKLKIKNKKSLFPQPEIHRDQRLSIEYNDIKL